KGIADREQLLKETLTEVGISDYVLTRYVFEYNLGRNNFTDDLTVNLSSDSVGKFFDMLREKFKFEADSQYLDNQIVNYYIDSFNVSEEIKNHVSKHCGVERKDLRLANFKRKEKLVRDHIEKEEYVQLVFLAHTKVITVELIDGKAQEILVS
ncbi:MAG: hypothetical protein H7Y04_08285, partial [Verrucomicrobia bacterium]|nr:hypothetical protein [Cytophagales bacterium]